MADIGDARVGSILRFNGELCLVTEYMHRTPGNLRAFYQLKMKNLTSGKVVENRFRAGEQIEIARVEFKEMQFIFPEGDHIVVMDNETFEQVYVPATMFGDNGKLLKEGMTVKIAFENEQPITAEAPTFVELEVTYTEPGLKGDTATNTLKQATLETGAVVNVPLFVNIGEVIKIDTRDWSYTGKVK
ncbi:MAG: elongation factor P [Bacteroidetes bacterium]|nr:MAG: elongation factor P [Bacteroidota bacterium]